MKMKLVVKSAYVIFFFAVAGFVGFGRAYYFASPGNRIRLPLHPVFRQSGSVGHFLGILGALFMVLLLGYSLRKRLRFMWKWGNANDWLEVHIFFGISGPILVLFHTVFKFSGIVGVSFWSMVLVVVSGIVGRYIYQSIPRSISGTELSRIELEAEEIGVTYELRKRIPRGHPFWNQMDGFEASLRSTPSGFLRSLRDGSQLRASFNRALKTTKALGSAERRKLLSLVLKRQKLIRRKQFLDRTQKILYYWHIFHVPFVILMFLILAVHIYISVKMGNTWIL
jgi:hypothetical protein